MKLKLNKVLKNLTKTVDDLDKFVEQNGEQIKADRLELEIKERQQERATEVAAKFKDLLGV